MKSQRPKVWSVAIKGIDCGKRSTVIDILSTGSGNESFQDMKPPPSFDKIAEQQQHKSSLGRSDLGFVLKKKAEVSGEEKSIPT
jgi:hypothetical protein